MRVEMLMVTIAVPFVHLVCGSARGEVIYESAELGATGQTGGIVVSAEQFIGSRFHVAEAVAVSGVGGHMRAVASLGDERLFAAIIVLSGPGTLPEGSPLAQDEILAATTFEPSVLSSDVLVPLSVRIGPGDYALVFGSGMSGATGEGRLPINNIDLADANTVGWFDLGGGFQWYDLGATGTRLVVEGTILVDTDGDGVADLDDVCCNTPPGRVVDDRGRPLGDLDVDCDVDLDDFALLQGNFTGPTEGDAPCRCTADADCDDGLFCDGAETCSNDGGCVAGTEPCDDGKFCNGQETCDEDNDICVDGSDPCDAMSEGCDETDDECISGCGNGIVEAGEDCESGDCCDLGTCQFEVVGTECRASTGSCNTAEQCTGLSAACPADISINTCTDSDGCCPPGCSNNNDDDCLADCGNGITEGNAGEECDDGNNVNTDACTNACTLAFCGDGIIQTSPPNQREDCDGGACCDVDCTFIEANPAKVCRPAAGDCDVAEFCTGNSAFCPANVLQPNGTECRSSTGGCDPVETCTGLSAACPADDVITTCTDGDGCCPAGCNNGNDDDCMAVCGNNVLEAGEDCEAGDCCDPDNCQFEAVATECRASVDACDPSEACDGGSADCRADVTITTCTDGDGCCPAGCNSGNDDDCP